MVNPNIKQELLAWYDAITEKKLLLLQTTHTHPKRRARHGCPFVEHPFGNLLATHRTRMHPTFVNETQTRELLPICG
jgi:hypothetical protein